VCLFVGLAYAVLLYYRNRRSAGMSRGLAIALGLLRFAAVTIIAFLILGPVIKYQKVTIEPPVLVIAVDNSTSMVTAEDSAQANRQAEDIRRVLGELHDRLADRYEVAQYIFGQEVKQSGEADFSEPVTDLSEVFESLKNRYANRNLGGVILATDGIYNRGRNPRYSTSGLRTPVHTLAFGDTTVRRDVKIAETGSNRIAFLNNRFSIEARVEADKMAGQTLEFTVSEGGEVLFRESVEVDDDHFAHHFRALPEADKPGLREFVLEVAGIEGEVTLANNTRSVFVDVIDSRRKVLIVAEAPHPDVAAIGRAIAGNENYEVVTRTAADFDGNLSEYDLVITHDIPGAGSAGKAFARVLADSDLPFLAIAGLGIDTRQWDEMPTGLNFSGGNRLQMRHSDVSGWINKSFARFALPEGLPKLLSEAPPVQAPFGATMRGGSTEAVLWQRIGPVETTDPLLVVSEVNMRRTAAMAGEGMWRWRIYNYAMEEDHAVFDQFINGIVQYLALKEDRRFFRVENAEEYMENQRVVLRAELYDENYEPVTDHEISLVITDAEGRTYPFAFIPAGSGYRADAGILPAGRYSYEASVNRAGRTYTETGSFHVRTFDLENANLTADHQLLRAISANSGGHSYTPEKAGELADLLLNDDAGIKPMSHRSQELRSLLEFKWIFFVLLALLSVEWFARKRSGFY